MTETTSDMAPAYWLQFLLFSTAVLAFKVFIYIVYYTDTLRQSLPVANEFDVIIVGAGTAGSLIAHRLSTETNYTYIVLEAGGKSNLLFEIPVLGPLLHGSIYDWNFETVPQVNACLSMRNRKCKLPQGKIVGGSSKLNDMIHVRGNISHYVDWFHGKYNEEEIKNHFKYTEKHIFHLNDIRFVSSMADGIIAAAKQLSSEYPNIDQLFSKVILTQKDGKRWCTSDHLQFSRNVISNAFVEKVIFNGNTAVGVSYIVSGQQKQIYAKRGVVLSAGTFNSPKILQLSGVGPEALLKKLNISVKINLPVGENLQDHVTTGLDLVMFNKSLDVNAMNIMNPMNILDYFVNGIGPFTFPGCEAIGFVSTKNETDPDIQFMVLPVGISSDRGSHLKDVIGISDDIWNNYFAKTFEKHTATILPIILHPKSKGFVKINSTAASIPPLIHPNYLSHEEDVQTLVRALNIVQKLVNTESMKSIGAFMNPIPLPSCNNFELFSYSYWKCYVKHVTLTSYHPVGTCSMGLPTSNNSVVDTSFKVLGLNNLFVVDGSVLPTLPSGNINAAIAMMANIFFEDTLNIQRKSLFSSKGCQRLDYVYEIAFSICFSYL